MLKINTKSKEFSKTPGHAKEALQFAQFSLDHAADAIFWMGPDARFVYVNDAACRTLGYSRNELLNMTVHDIDPDFPQDVWSQHWYQIRCRGTMTFESHHRTKNGKIFPVEISANFLKFDGREYNCAFARNITKRKKTQNILKKSEERYRTLVENVGLGITLVDEQHNIVTVNSAVSNLFGKPASQLVGKKCYNKFEKRQEICPHCPGIKALNSRKTEEVETEGVRNDGTLFQVRLRAFPMFDNAGKPTGFIEVVEDITERKHIENALKESEQRYRRLVETMNEGLSVTDEKFVFTFANKRFAELLGYNPDEIVGRHITEFFDEENKKIIEEQIAKRKKGQESSYDITWTAKDGKKLDTIISPRAFFDEQGNFKGSLGILTDITERKQAMKILKNEKDNFLRILDAMKDGVYITNQNYDIQYVNPILREDFGPYEEKKCYEYFHDRKEVCPWCKNLEVFAGKTVRWEWYSPKNGKTYDLLDTPLKNPDGTISKLEIFRDITERKEWEKHQLLAEKILQCLNRADQSVDLVHEVLTLLKFTGFDAVGIRLWAGEDFPYFETSGFTPGFVQMENSLCARDENGQIIRDLAGKTVLECMCGRVLSGKTDPSLPFFTKGGSFWTNSTTELLASSVKADWKTRMRNRCNTAGYESVALVPLRSMDQIVGLLQLNDTQKDCFTLETIHFFEGICASIGIALSRIRAEQQIESMAKFPSENPCQVLRIAKDGTALYANSSGRELLSDWGCQIGEKIPHYWHKHVMQLLNSGVNKEFETTCCDNRIFSLVFAPIPDAEYVNIYGTDVTERKHAEQKILKLNEELEQRVAERTVKLLETNRKLLQEIEQCKVLEKEILDISEREQRRIGRELHDSVGQQFTGIAFMAKVLEQKLADKLPEQASDAAEISKLVNDATEQTRSLAKLLHPVDLKAGSLLLALQELTTTTQRLFGVNCTFQCNEPVAIEDTSVAVHIYRITQEAMTNAIRHGSAKNIKVTLTFGKERSVLTVKNDGVDFPKEFETRGTGMGLQIMDHRVDIIGGSLSIHKAANGGTVVTCIFPNKNPQKE